MARKVSKSSDSFHPRSEESSTLYTRYIHERALCPRKSFARVREALVSKKEKERKNEKEELSIKRKEETFHSIQEKLSFFIRVIGWGACQENELFNKVEIRNN